MTMMHMMKAAGKILSALACAALLAAGAPCAAQQPSVPYVPTPQSVVDRMLTMAKVTARDYLIDLGSGDGRIVVTAAEKFGARGFGVDLNPLRINEANENARKSGVNDKVAFYQRDLFKIDLTEATVITMYLLPRVNMALRPKLLDLRPGTRLVSHDFDMGDWKADEQVRVGVGDKYFSLDGESDIYFWVVPAKVGGVWRTRLTVAGKTHDYEIILDQKFQEVRGTVRVKGRAAPIQSARLRGAELSFSFSADLNGVPVKHELSGRVDGGRIVGEAGLSGSRIAARVEWIGERATTAAGRSGSPNSGGTGL